MAKKFIRNCKQNIKKNDKRRAKMHEIVRNKRRNVKEKVVLQNSKRNPKDPNEIKHNSKKVKIKIEQIEQENITQELFWKEEIKQSFKRENEDCDRLNDNIYEVPHEAKDNDTIMIDKGKNNRPNKEVGSISTQTETKKERSKRAQHIRNRCVTHFMDSVFEVLNTICGKKLEKVNILELFGYSVEDYKVFFGCNPILIFSIEKINAEIFEKMENDKNKKLFENLFLKEIYEENYLLNNKNFKYKRETGEKVNTLHICCFDTLKIIKDREIKGVVAKTLKKMFGVEEMKKILKKIKEEEKEKEKKKEEEKEKEKEKEKKEEKEEQEKEGEEEKEEEENNQKKIEEKIIEKVTKNTFTEPGETITYLRKKIKETKEYKDLITFLNYAENLINDIYQEEGRELKPTKLTKPIKPRKPRKPGKLKSLIEKLEKENKKYLAYILINTH